LKTLSFELLEQSGVISFCLPRNFKNRFSYIWSQHKGKKSDTLAHQTHTLDNLGAFKRIIQNDRYAPEFATQSI
jgi:hypothetical protein